MSHTPPPASDALRSLAYASRDLSRSWFGVGQGNTSLFVTWVRLSLLSAYLFPLVGMALFIYSFTDNDVEWWLGLSMLVFAPLALNILVLISALIYNNAVQAQAILEGRDIFFGLRASNSANVPVSQSRIPSPSALAAEPAAMEVDGLVQLEIDIRLGSSVAGMSLGSISLPDGATLVSVLRGGEPLTADLEMILAVGDVLVVVAPAAQAQLIGETFS